MVTKQDYFPDEELLERKRVLEAMDRYVEAYRKHKREGDKLAKESINAVVADELEFPLKPLYFPGPNRKAKEIALEAALKLISGSSTEVIFGPLEENKSRTVKLAEEIYQWLIKQ